MSDDLSKAIKQIGEIFSQDKGGDNLKSLLSLLGSTGGKEDEANEDKKHDEIKSESYPTRDSSQDNLEMVRQITNIMKKLNTKSDSRVNLLNSLRPFLNHKRQKKLNNCVMLLQVTTLMQSMDE